jgi:hypothetical protein
MPKFMFEEDNSLNQLITIVNALNSSMADVGNATTVEEVQAIVNNLNRVINDLNKLIQSMT